MSGRQLPLEVRLRDSARFENFHAGDNRELIDQLQRMAAGDGERLCYCWSAAGHGRTHLLQAACHAARKTGRSAMYVDLNQSEQLSPAVLDGLAGVDLVCLDDIQAIMGDAGWEEALFVCFNALRDAGAGLLVSADRAPARLTLALADLRSRLEWGLVYQVRPLTDAQRLQALQLRARARGFDLPDDTARYLMLRVPRAMPALFDLLEALDTASLAARKRLTVPFVKEVLKL